jgi:hypothetical protein
MALARFSGNRINSFDDNSDTKPEVIYCRLYFDKTARALMTDHYWPFAKERAQLTRDTTDPAFQYNYAYYLPVDFLRVINVYGASDHPTGKTYYTYEFEISRTKESRQVILSSETTCYLKYIKWEEDICSWDVLFVEAFILTLAQQLCRALSQDEKVKEDIDNDLDLVMRKVRAMNRQEQEVIGKADLRTWQDARWSDTP